MDDHPGQGAVRGTERMEIFAHAVFAIAFALPVLELKVPEPGPGFAGRLLELWPFYLAYALSVLVIGLYWVHHHFSGAIYRTTGHWFLIATVAFLTMIGFIAYPARVLSETWPVAAARREAAQFWVASLAVTSWSWLLKWSVGFARGHVDARLDQSYVRRLNRHYWRLALANLAATVLVFVSWQAGLALSTLVFAVLLLPPETPRYRTEAPVVEGEA